MWVYTVYNRAMSKETPAESLLVWCWAGLFQKNSFNATEVSVTWDPVTAELLILFKLFIDPLCPVDGGHCH